MDFKIIHNERALTIDELDKEAAAFFGVEYNDNEYAKPSKYNFDWTDIIIHAISCVNERNINWTKVIEKILSNTTSLTRSYDDLQKSIKMFRPYIELCYFWQAKKYIIVNNINEYNIKDII